MEFAKDFPIWDKLTKEEQERLRGVSVFRRIKAGTMLHHGTSDCLGLLLIRSGQLRVYTLSHDGREVTLYRLLDMDICLLSASCVMPNIQFEVIVEAEKDTELWVIPSCLYKELMQNSVAIANFTNELISIRFSEIMCVYQFKRTKIYLFIKFIARETIMYTFNIHSATFISSYSQKIISCRCCCV